MDKWTDRKMKWMNRWINGQIDRKTDYQIKAPNS